MDRLERPLTLATRVILVSPSLSENVGAVARSMGHFGLTELVLVGGVSPLDARARTLAAGHDAILEAARVVPDLATAVAGASFVIGTSARDQPGVDRVAESPRAVAGLAAAHASTGPVALVFGPEKRGLTNAELRCCDQIATIDGMPGTCLNLAQAVTVFAYEFSLVQQNSEGERPASALAAEAGIADLAGTLTEALLAAGLVKPREAERKGHTLRRVLSRALLSPDEAAMLLGIARAALHRGAPHPPSGDLLPEGPRKGPAGPAPFREPLPRPGEKG